MKLNNKGVTLVEIIISVALISIVLVFLFSLLIQVNNQNSDNEIKSSYLIYQSTFTKQIEEDFLDYKLSSATTSCNAQASTGETNKDYLYLPNWDGTNIKCLKFTLTESPEYAYLFLYKLRDDRTVLSYYRGDYKQSVELEEFDWDYNSSYNVCNNCSDEKVVNHFNYQVYSLPIIGPDYNDYSINLSYVE